MKILIYILERFCDSKYLLCVIIYIRFDISFKRVNSPLEIERKTFQKTRIKIYYFT